MIVSYPLDLGETWQQDGLGWLRRRSGKKLADLNLILEELAQDGRLPKVFLSKIHCPSRG